MSGLQLLPCFGVIEGKAIGGKGVKLPPSQIRIKNWRLVPDLFLVFEKA